jgi:predicted alpha/beta-fold hydrolase
MGEYAKKIPNTVKKAIGVSVPCDLKGSAKTISKFENTLYKNNFLKTLKEKALKKIELHPDNQLDANKIINAKSFKEFDNAFTAPSNEFLDAEDYWHQSSCNLYLSKINKPSLLITALDDPFLSETCYPFEIAENNPNFYILATKYGGHVGFCEKFDMNTNFWLERQIETFLTSPV